MAEEVVHVVEDAFHRLQTPKPDAAPTDDDLANAAQVAIWARDPTLHDRVHASAAAGRVVLTGKVDTAEQREQAIAAVLGVGEVVNDVSSEIEISGEEKTMAQPAAEPIVTHEAVAEPMLYVTRYCSLDSSSLTAALCDGLDELDRHFAALGVQPPTEVVVVYRNRLPESIVLDIGYPISFASERGTDQEVKLGHTPHGSMIAMLAAHGADGLLAAHDRLLRHSPGKAAGAAWQRLPVAHVRQRSHAPAARLYLPVGGDKSPA